MRKVNFFIGTLSTGGAERVVSNLSINLNKKITRRILLFGENSKIDYPYNGELVYLDKFKHMSISQKIKAIVSRIFKVKKLKSRDSVTISFLEYPNLINLLTYKNGKTIISVRNHMSTKHNRGFKAKLWNATIKLLYPKADLIIAVSKEIKRDLIKNYNINEDKIKVIYNSYDIELIKEMAKEEIDNNHMEIYQNPVIITVGRLNNQKGQWHLIRAFKEVKKRIPDAELIFLGKGDLESYLIKISEDLGLNNNVHFLGFQNNPFKYIRNAKVFVLSSLHEGFPNALAEAMACGTPVVASDCLSGPREILASGEFDLEAIDYHIDNERFGLLVPVCDGNKYSAKDPLIREEIEMANSIINLLEDEEQWNYFNKKSRERIENFEIGNIIKEWESVIYQQYFEE